MKTFDTIGAARDAIADTPIASLPENMQERFRSLRSSPSPVDQIVNLGEFIYANRGEVDDQARELAAGLVAFATVNAWHGLLEGARGDRIVQALRRDLGEDAPAGMAWPEEASDPLPRPTDVLSSPASPPDPAAPAA